ncbi:hypothetical protein SteCoe_3688 [Stentor coeruleus]|uniref:Uncharacterized protein n=1 Tax=Stentor coeruleus TaxID=5963 RepID=A0A1R2CWG1_9CILI|nr:hypothetical protein SteCoe_3688 [Stentor coeruleus]
MDTSKHSNPSAIETKGSRHGNRDQTPTSTRKRLLEQALNKDKLSTRNKSVSVAKSSEKNVLNSSKAFSQVGKQVLPRGSLTNKPHEEPCKAGPIQERVHRSKSPSCTKRENSLETSKGSRINRRKSAERLKPAPVIQTVPKKSIEKPADCIGKIANQFSVKKVQDLKDCSIKGNEELGRALLVMLSDVDYHIKDSPYYSVDIFLDYISSPGIVVQTLKKIQTLIVTEKITEKNIANSYEIFSKIDMVTNSPGHLLMAALMDTIFKFKNLPGKYIKFIKQSDVPKVVAMEKLNQTVAEVKKVSKAPKKTHAKTESLGVPISVLITKEETLIESTSEKSESEISLNNTIEPMSVPEKLDSFKDSKKILLDKFFTRMLNPLTPHEETITDRSPLQDIHNKSFERSKPVIETKGHIRIKHFSRPSSATPRLDPKVNIAKELEKKIVIESKVKTPMAKTKIEELRRKNIMIGSRFYKRLEEKFIEIFLEKMKKEPRDLKKLSMISPDDYAKRKEDYIQTNKEVWIKDTIKVLENMEFGENNENESLVETKHSAFLEYINQEKNISQLIFRAEQIELATRKL